MAKGRMIHTKIWDCEQFLELKAWERLLYIALIVLADDEGCFRADGSFWKRKILHDQKIGSKQIEEMIDRIEQVGLIVTGETKKGRAGFHPNWHEHQTLRSDRSKPSPFVDLLVANGLSPRFTQTAEENLRKPNITKDKEREAERSEAQHQIKENSQGLSSMREAIPDQYRDNFPLL